MNRVLQSCTELGGCESAQSSAYPVLEASAPNPGNHSSANQPRALPVCTQGTAKGPEVPFPVHDSLRVTQPLVWAVPWCSLGKRLGRCGNPQWELLGNHQPCNVNTNPLSSHFSRTWPSRALTLWPVTLHPQTGSFTLLIRYTIYW